MNQKIKTKFNTCKINKNLFTDKGIIQAEVSL